MKLDLQIKTSQSLMLSQAMKQSLSFLQLPLQELQESIRELSLSNPLIELDDSRPGEVSLEHISNMEEQSERFNEYNSVNDGDSEKISINADLQLAESFHKSSSSAKKDDSETADASAFLSRPQTLNEYLHEQLGTKANIESRYAALVSYIIDCLSSSGYLDISLDELSEELQVDINDLEEALFILQAFHPSGVGARSLSECLLIQISQRFAENEDSGLLNNSRSIDIDACIALIMKGLELLGKHDYKALSKLLGLSLDDTKAAAEVIVSLNPIPSRGFYSENTNAVILPDAFINVDGINVDITINRRALPQVRLDKYYSSLIADENITEGNEEANAYLRTKLKEATEAINGIKNRASTIERVIKAIVNKQQPFFIHGGELLPLTRSEIADELELSSSTISRAVKNKYIQFQGHIMSLDMFFSNAVGLESGQNISASAIKEQLKRIIDNEDKKKPLSDQEIEKRFIAMGINISRRTVAKYRAQLDIPSTSQRRES